MKRATKERISAIETAAELIRRQEDYDSLGSYRMSDADMRALHDMGELLMEYSSEVTRFLIKLSNEET
jgi:hypothetical protein